MTEDLKNPQLPEINRPEAEAAQTTRDAVNEAVKKPDIKSLSFEELKEALQIAKATFRIRKVKGDNRWHCENAAGENFFILKIDGKFKVRPSDSELPPETTSIGKILNNIYNRNTYNLKSGFDSLDELKSALEKLMRELDCRLID